MEALVAQVSTKSYLSDDKLKGIIYRKETTFDAKLHTDGWAIAINFGDIKTYYRTHYYHLEFGTMHSGKEHKQTKNINIIDNALPKDFKFGKQNSVYILRGSKGTKKYFSDKAKRKGVALGHNLSFGPSIAILKPYYLKFIEQRVFDGTIENYLVDEKYTSEGEEKFLDYNRIYGGSNFSKGLKEIGFVPGIQSKFGLFFSVGSFDEYVKAAEIGLMADAYIKKIPIMVETSNVKNSPLFLNLYVNLHFGKRKN
jgi:hypothetical protein